MQTENILSSAFTSPHRPSQNYLFFFEWFLDVSSTVPNEAWKATLATLALVATGTNTDECAQDLPRSSAIFHRISRLASLSWGLRRSQKQQQFCFLSFPVFSIQVHNYIQVNYLEHSSESGSWMVAVHKSPK